MVKKNLPKPVPIIKTKELILQIAEDGGLSKKTFLEECKANNCNGAFNPKNWDKYLQVIWKYRVLHSGPIVEQRCAICGEVMKVDPDLRGLFRLSPMTGMRCNDRHHFFMLLDADKIMQENKCSFEQAVQIVCFIEAGRTIVYEDKPFNFYTEEQYAEA